VTSRLRRRLLLCLTLCCCSTAAAQPGDNVSRYRKVIARIPMRDGAVLATNIYVPRDTTQSWPILMQRTPYSTAPYGADSLPTRLGPSAAFEREGFIFVHQDVRGRYQSTGTWLEMTPHKAVHATDADVDESTDAYDTISWLLANVPHHNGRVGLWGVSYPGFYVTASSINAHPALVAISPQAPVTDLADGDDGFHNGAFMLAANATFYRNFTPHRTPVLPGDVPRQPTPPEAADAYRWFLGAGQLQASRAGALGANEYWRAFFEHPTYDSYWAARAIQRQITAGIQFPPASLTVGGWYDAEDPNGPLLTFRAISAAFGLSQSRGAGVVSHHLVMGPWSHGQWSRDAGARLGGLVFGSETGTFYRDSIEFPFFMQHLKDGPPAELAVATLFDTGLNVWRRFSRWPEADRGTQTWYLQNGFTLDSIAPEERTGSDRYTSDPAQPVPYVDRVVPGMARDYITDDQRFAARRADVVAYRSAPLNRDVTVGGAVRVMLHVATTGTDADFIVKLIDVYPDGLPGDTIAVRMSGYQRMVRGEPFRARYRRGMDRSVPFVANRPDSLTFSLPDVLHTFRSGHRIMVQVQSSWFPLIDRNPQRFVPNIFTATPADFRKANMTIFRSAERPSRIELPVLR
jgi:putative CocE/NonD family hydrolase